MSEVAQQILRKIELMKNRNGYTDNQIAEGVGLTPSGYCRIVKGQRGLRIDFLEKVANFFDVPVAYLLLEPDSSGRSIRERFKRYLEEGSRTTEEIAAEIGVTEEHMIDYLAGESVLSQEMRGLREALSRLLGVDSSKQKIQDELVRLLLLEVGMEESKISVILENLNQEKLS